MATSTTNKSLRGGDADGALYYCCRMLEGGEEPRYLTRRLIRFASEDVGLADPLALQQAVAADAAVHAIGMPECGVCIAQCAVYLALAPKSVAVYRAYNAAMKSAADEPRCPVPMHIRNAPTKLMREVGCGKGYQYNPGSGYQRGCPGGYLPPELGAGRTFFDPRDCEPPHELKFCPGGKK
jgi:putative ATPase